ncbi:MAG TPA: hypothetical protein VMJ72_01440 [Candidatus Paceibacterota bacterium]|nr:hypothetical protein [Candidatus Paceibacterota bacterium]
MKRLVLFAVVLAAAVLPSCGGGGTTSSTPAVTITVTSPPANASYVLGVDPVPIAWTCTGCDTAGETAVVIYLVSSGIVNGYQLGTGNASGSGTVVITGVSPGSYHIEVDSYPNGYGGGVSPNFQLVAAPAATAPQNFSARWR